VPYVDHGSLNIQWQYELVFHDTNIVNVHLSVIFLCFMKGFSLVLFCMGLVFNFRDIYGWVGRELDNTQMIKTQNSYGP
jgi:hypothetical protein